MATGTMESLKGIGQSASIGMNGFKLSVANAGGIVPFFKLKLLVWHQEQ